MLTLKYLFSSSSSSSSSYCYCFSSSSSSSSCSISSSSSSSSRCSSCSSSSNIFLLLLSYSFLICFSSTILRLLFFVSTHFVYGYTVSDIWQRTNKLAKEETHMSYSFLLAVRHILYTQTGYHMPRPLLFLVYWLEREIFQWVHREGSIRRSTTHLHLAPVCTVQLSPCLTTSSF